MNYLYMSEIALPVILRNFCFHALLQRLVLELKSLVIVKRKKDLLLEVLHRLSFAFSLLYFWDFRYFHRWTGKPPRRNCASLYKTYSGVELCGSQNSNIRCFAPASLGRQWWKLCCSSREEIWSWKRSRKFCNTYYWYRWVCYSSMKHKVEVAAASVRVSVDLKSINTTTVPEKPLNQKSFCL